LLAARRGLHETPVKGLRTRADLKRLGLGLVSILMALFAA
jgi:hypothetical protein